MLSFQDVKEEYTYLIRGKLSLEAEIRETEVRLKNLKDQLTYYDDDLADPRLYKAKASSTGKVTEEEISAHLALEKKYQELLKKSSRLRFYHRIKLYDKWRISRSVHHFWWFVHNCIAHPLIGVVPSHLTFQLHDWTSNKINLLGHSIYTPTPDDWKVFSQKHSEEHRNLDG